MKSLAAAELLAALGHEARLEIFRMLVRAGDEGLAAGAVAAKLDLAAATVSFHLAHLSRTGLIQARPSGRHIFYTANFPVMDRLLAYLTRDCCQGQPCLPLLERAQKSKGSS